MQQDIVTYNDKAVKRIHRHKLLMGAFNLQMLKINNL